MAIAFIRENTAVNATLATNISHTVTTPATGNLLILTAVVANTIGVTSLSGVATTWTKQADWADTGGIAAIRTEIWFGTGPFSGTTVTIAKGASGTASSAEFSGTTGSSAQDFVFANDQSSGLSVANAWPQTANAVGSLLFSGIGWRNASATNTGPGGGYNALTGLVTGARANPSTRPVYQIVTDTSSHTASWTTTSGGTNSYSSIGFTIPVPILPPSRFVYQAVQRAAVI